MKRTLDFIVIHCSASPNDKAFKAKDIDAWHKERGFKRGTQAVRNYNQELKYIGYHYVIERDGNIALGRHIEEVGAHVAGHNAKSIGICMIGMDEFTPEQWASLKQLIITLASKIYGKPTNSIKSALGIFKLMDITICGHRDLSPDKDGDGEVEKHEWVKTCPNFSVKEKVHEWRTEAGG